MEPPGRTVTRPALATNWQHPPPKARSSPRSWTRRRHWRGLTAGTLRSELAAIAVPSTGDGRNRVGDDFALTADWADAVMPALCRAGEREYTAAEREALGNAIAVLGNATVDVYLNDSARWSNIPAAVWNYKQGGYQVLKKWLSYRESKVLGRSLVPEEVQHFTYTARRIAMILRLLG